MGVGFRVFCPEDVMKVGSIDTCFRLGHQQLSVELLAGMVSLVAERPTL